MSINFKFYSGFSSSDSVGKDGTYLYSENINSTNPEYIQVSPKVQTLVTTEEKINYLVLDPGAYYSDNFQFVSGFKILNSDKSIFYDHNNGITDINGYGPNSPVESWRQFLVAIKNPDYSYTINGPAVEDHNGGKRFGSFGFFSLVGNDIRGYHRYNPRTVYTGDVTEFKGKIFLTNHLLVTYKYGYDSNSLETSDGVGSNVGVSRHSDGFKLFSRSGVFGLFSTKGGGSRELGAVIDSYELNIRIICARGYSGVDYLFADEGLFFLNGINAGSILYKNTSNYLDFERFNFYDLKWKYIRNGKFIYSITKTKKGFDLNVLGSSAVGSPINFSSVVSKENWEDVSSMIQYKDGVLISYKDKNGTYGIDYFSFSNTEKNEKGYLITKEYVGDGQIFLKKAKSLKFFCDKLKENEYIKIFASINNGEFEEVKTLTHADRWKNGFFEILSFNKEFHKIVFKLELKGDFKLYDFIFLDDKIK